MMYVTLSNASWLKMTAMFLFIFLSLEFTYIHLQVSKSGVVQHTSALLDSSYERLIWRLQGLK